MEPEKTSWLCQRVKPLNQHVDGLRSENRDLGFTRFGAGVSHRFPGCSTGTIGMTKIHHPEKTQVRPYRDSGGPPISCALA